VAGTGLSLVEACSAVVSGADGGFCCAVVIVERRGGGRGEVRSSVVSDNLDES
jgi:hypothetical protein